MNATETVGTPTAARSDRLAAALEERELDALLVTNLVNVRYLTGFTGTNGACVVARGERLFVNLLGLVSSPVQCFGGTIVGLSLILSAC